MILKARTTAGEVSGAVSDIHTISVFKGIPFAAPPVGNLRWRRPQPAIPWEGVKECIRFSPKPMQVRRDPEDFSAKEFYGEEFPMSEDCLYLNVWTPAKSPDDKLPVYVFFYGGSYVRGTTTGMQLDMLNMSKQGIVCVTPNYRVGLFGFLAHPELDAENDEHVSGNYGLLDQIAALKWVRDNIARFGGDPEKVTIGGQSAGAVSGQILSVSPLARGLFRGAIMQSGAGLMPWMRRPIATLAGYEKDIDLKKQLGVESVAQARKLDAGELMARMAEAKKNGCGLHFHELVDGYVLPMSESAMVYHGKAAHINYMLGGNSYEYTFEGQTMGGFTYTADSEYEDRASDFYKLADCHDQKDLDEFLKVYCVMRSGALSFAECVQALPETKVYVYYFDHDMPGDDAGCFHGSENWYCNGTLMHSWRPFTGEDYDLSMQMMGYWSNFIKTGDPNGCDCAGRILPVWDSYTHDDPDTQILKVGMTDSAPMQDHPSVQFEVNYLLNEYYKKHDL